MMEMQNRRYSIRTPASVSGRLAQTVMTRIVTVEARLRISAALVGMDAVDCENMDCLLFGLSFSGKKNLLATTTF
jgi:hypothetical protein